jgi:hypothetical protein
MARATDQAHRPRARAALAGLALALTTAVAVGLAAPGCLEGRFPTCKDNEECQKKTDGGAPVCYDLRCVECHYDVDCAPGKACNNNNVCEGLGTGDVDAGEPSSKWESGNWDDCARDCKDPDCVKSCDAKFPKADKSKKPPPKK